MSILSICSSRALSYLCFILSCFSAGSVAGADPITYTLTGTVRDSENGELLVGAHVFLMESTVGAVTDADGQFNLDGLPAGEYNLGVSMIGFQTHSLRVNLTSRAAASEKCIEIHLVPQVYQLAQLTVTGKRDRRWRKQLAAFELQVIGDSDNAGQTHIVNPEVINFIQQEDALLAEAHETLIIENMAMGYRIYYTLVHCAIQQEFPQYKGIARFEEMEPESNKQRRRWDKNRKLAYNGSFKHLLRTLATVDDVQDIKDEGFYLAVVPEFPTSIKSYDEAIWNSQTSINDLVQKSANENESTLHLNNYLLITYTGELESSKYIQNQLFYARDPDVQRSTIKLRKANTIFHNKGFLYDAYSVVLHGYMGWERMADMLPLDYEPME